MDIIQLKKCGRTANNKLLVQLLKARKKKRKSQEYRLVQNVASYKAHLK
jgi:hypothetical protein